MNPTTKQIEALRNFNVPEVKIQALSFEQASQMLTELIKRARSVDKDKPHVKDNDPLSHVTGNLNDATNIVMDYFGIKDRSQLKEVHIALIQEMSRQVYGLKYWLGKSSTHLQTSEV